MESPWTVTGVAQAGACEEKESRTLPPSATVIAAAILRPRQVLLVPLAGQLLRIRAHKDQFRLRRGSPGGGKNGVRELPDPVKPIIRLGEAWTQPGVWRPRSIVGIPKADVHPCPYKRTGWRGGKQRLRAGCAHGRAGGRCPKGTKAEDGAKPSSPRRDAAGHVGQRRPRTG